MILPTRPIMLRTLERVLPGTSPVVRRMREQVLEFSSSLTGRAVLLKGPIGSGKSTVARLLGLLKRVAPLMPGEAARILDDARYEGHNRVDLRYIPWYLELTLTGLVETLAETQLFGATKGAYTGSTAQRAGVFEQASTGRSQRGKEHDAANLTGGVVFLDEIGDLAPPLQAKLLPVLSGGAFYRIGGEGDEHHELTFRGTTITASWRRLDTGLLRPDLLSRISSYTIEVPGLREREADFDLLLDEVQSSLVASLRQAIDHADVVEPKLDRSYWRARKESIRPVDKTTRNRLAQVDWGNHGNLRGLTSVLEQIIVVGRPVEAVVEELPPILAESGGDRPAGDGLLHRLLSQANPQEGLAGHVRAIEVDQRRWLREQLLSDLPLRRALATQLGLTDEKLTAQIHQLDRRRRKGLGDDS